ncbi:MAG: ABC transporter substrate-binding protein [Bacteroidota bacterium]
MAAEAHKDELLFFNMRDYKIPYSYSPVIAASESRINQRMAAYKSFMNASKKGYLYCQENPEASTEILRKHLPLSEKGIDLMKALEISSPSFGNKDSWGKMSEAVISTFMQWITAENLEHKSLKITDIMTNKCLE